MFGRQADLESGESGVQKHAYLVGSHLPSQCWVSTPESTMKRACWSNLQNIAGRVKEQRKRETPHEAGRCRTIVFHRVVLLHSVCGIAKLANGARRGGIRSRRHHQMAGGEAFPQREGSANPVKSEDRSHKVITGGLLCAWCHLCVVDILR